MNNQEIFSLIKNKQEEIDKLIDPTTFILNDRVVQLQKEIAELQEQCQHEYDNDICKYCGKEKI